VGIRLGFFNIQLKQLDNRSLRFWITAVGGDFHELIVPVCEFIQETRRKPQLKLSVLVE
jgi:hypothetical protein